MSLIQEEACVQIVEAEVGFLLKCSPSSSIMCGKLSGCYLIMLSEFCR